MPRLPSNWIAIDVEPMADPSDRPSVEMLRWGAGHYHAWVRAGEELRREQDGAITGPDALWDIVGERLRPDRPLTLIADGALRLLHLSGFFGRVESFEFSLISPVEEVVWTEGAPELKKTKPRGTWILGDPPTIIAGSFRGRRLRIVDWRNYRIPLEDGPAFGMSRHAPVDPPADGPSLSIADRVRTRSASLKSAIDGLVEYWRRNALGAWKWTVTGLAYAHWKRSVRHLRFFAPSRPEVPPETAHALYGGRFEAFFHGAVRSDRLYQEPEPTRYRGDWGDAIAEPVYYLDVRSLYPSVMKRELYPTNYLTTYREQTPRQVRDRIADCAACGLVEIRSDETEYPVRLQPGDLHGLTEQSVPARHPFDPAASRVLYPRGHYHTWLAGPELSRALERGDLVQCHLLHLYAQDELFRDWVGDWWTRRRDCQAAGDMSGQSICKSIMNCLYGRFAMRTPAWVVDRAIVPEEPYGAWSEVRAETGESVSYRAAGGIVEREMERVLARGSIPLVAAYIASHGRLVMDRLRAAAGWQTVLIQACDAILVTQTGLDRLTSAGYVGPELGQLRITHGPIAAGVIADYHTYILAGKVVCQGRRLSHLDLRDGRYESLHESGPLESILRGPGWLMERRRVKGDMGIGLDSIRHGRGIFLRPRHLIQSLDAYLGG